MRRKAAAAATCVRCRRDIVVAETERGEEVQLDLTAPVHRVQCTTSKRRTARMPQGDPADAECPYHTTFLVEHGLVCAAATRAKEEGAR